MTLKTIVENNIEYRIDDKGTLKKLRSLPLGDEVVTIPHVLHTGDTIDALGASFAAGEVFNEIIVSDEITKISRKAFQFSKALAVHWSAGCKRIPSCCFEGSFIKTLTNIKGVSQMADDAFWACHITELEWPSHIKKIPRFCFHMSYIKKLTNIDNVTFIGEHAFSGSCIESFVWPSKCQAIPMCCFRKSKLRSISNVEHVVSIGAGAFEDVNLDTPVDFSNAIVIETNAFRNTDKSMITFPYYDMS